jgi:hypothetical protein
VSIPPLTHLAFVRYVARISQRSASWAADPADIIQHTDDGDRPISAVTVARYLEDMRRALDHIECQISRDDDRNLPSLDDVRGILK